MLRSRCSVVASQRATNPISTAADGGKAVVGKARLTEEQIASAGTLHATLAQWQIADKALGRLREAMPGFGREEALLKVVAINALYGTNVFALVRAATHVQKVLGSGDLAKAGPELVESLANIPTTSNARLRRYVSFASKFAHFFISPERFPIYDSYAERMVSLHLGSAAVRKPARPYEAFTANLERLKSEYGLRCSYRELDRYLWIAGLYRAYGNGERMLNAELLHLFDNPSAEQRALLATLRGD
jgi:DNA-binding ferritin-like protein (Dps family)